MLILDAVMSSAAVPQVFGGLLRESALPLGVGYFDYLCKVMRRGD